VPRFLSYLIQLPKRFSRWDQPRTQKMWEISRTPESKIPLLRLLYALYRLLRTGMSFALR
jgi:hypothetical protein